MTSSNYTSVFSITPEQIASLDENKLNSLMTDLLIAHAYRCKADKSRVIVNTEVKAADDGCDGWTPKPDEANSWYGTEGTCWQFKAGTNGQPAKLKGEVLKDIPLKTLKNNDRFVVIANSSVNGTKGEKERLDVLVSEANTANLPSEKIDVIGSERLSNWCNEHPAIASRYSGQPHGLWSLSHWTNIDVHAVAWQSTAEIEKEINDLRNQIDFHNGKLLHLHIEGMPGVGKTRFALELCRNAEWRDQVVYFKQATDSRLPELIDSVALREDILLVIVADEVQSENLTTLRDAVERANGRIRLITIGHGKTTDPKRIPSRKIVPLSKELLMKVVKGWYSGMPREHVEFVARVSEGYIRLARMVSDYVMENPSASAAEVFTQHHIRIFLDKMLGSEDKQSLHVLAALTIVGWEKEREEEGKAISDHLKRDWIKVRSDVERFDKKYGIAPYGGRYRYISPTPLGDYLALDAWESYPSLMKALPDALPTGASKNAFYERMKNIASNTQAREFAKEQLGFFLTIDDFNDDEKVRFWSAISSSNPTLAVRNVYQALTTSDNASRLKIEGGARRELIHTLVTLSWNADTFKESVLSLALLAEAENEKWANNASAEFINKFQIQLGGTSVPYSKRLEVIDELLNKNDEKINLLIINALAKVGEHSAIRSNSAPFDVGLPEPEWSPPTWQDFFDCISQAVSRLVNITQSKNPRLQNALVHAASKLAHFLENINTKEYAMELFLKIGENYPTARNSLSEIIRRLIDEEVEFKKRLKPEEIKGLEDLNQKFEDRSLSGRLHRVASKYGFEKDGSKDFVEVAKELLENFDVFKSEWEWITSGAASRGWFLGEAIELQNENPEILSNIIALPNRGTDLTFLCGFLFSRAKRYGNSWLDQWLVGYKKSNPNDNRLILEVCWRCDVTEASADLIVDILKTETVDKNLVAQFSFGRWSEKLTFDGLYKLIEVLVEKDHIFPAMVTFHDRIKKYPDEIVKWEKIALRLLTNGDLIRDRQMGGYHWRAVAFLYVDKYPTVIAKSILKEHGSRKKQTWFIEHSDADSILRRCAEIDPEGIWLEILSFISNKKIAYSFTVGFPPGLLERLPHEKIEAWVAELPDERAFIIVEMNGILFSSDNSLSEKIIGKYADNPHLASQFMSTFSSGFWVGEASSHWLGYADKLESVSKTSSLPKLKKWASNGALELRDRASKDLQREEEDNLRGYR